MAANTLIALVSILTFTSLVSCYELEYKFELSLEGLTTQYNIWHWNHRTNIPGEIPTSPEDGFAIMNTGFSEDELYIPDVALSNGFEYTIIYYVGSEFTAGTKLQLQAVPSSGSPLVLRDFSSNSGPYNNEWLTATGNVEPMSENLQLSIFCKTQDTSTSGNMYGCAIAEMSFIVNDSPPTTVKPTTTPEPTTTTTTPEPTTTTTTPEPTTTTTTPEPTTTTTTPEPTTTTTTPEPTTTTTTPEPTTTTTTPEPTTTASPTTTENPDDYTLDYNWEYNTQGWIMGRSNGAIWQRVLSDFGNITPPQGAYILRVYPVDIFSGNVQAMSPRLVVGALGEIKLTVYFYVTASRDYPVHLKIRRRVSFTTYDEEPAINLDTFGDQFNGGWMSHTDTFSGLTPGEEFNLVMEGNLGIQNYKSTIAVSRLLVEGASEIEYNEVDFFDFTDGLVGWQSGTNDGGKWVALTYDKVDPNVPPPSTGNLLMVDRFDIYSGIITIESPPIKLSPGTAKELQARFWINGTMEYPVQFRVGLKSLGGVYDSPPFIDLSKYGDGNPQNYAQLATYQPVPANPQDEYFQLVLEVDLGAYLHNNIAIDTITLRTVSTKYQSPDFNIVPEVLGYVKPTRIVEHDSPEAVIPEQTLQCDTTPATPAQTNYTLDYKFRYNSQGWSLGRSNGAAWQRVISGGYDRDPPVHPYEGQSYILQLFDTDVYSGTAVVMSPRLRVGPMNEIKLTLDFFINIVDDNYPAFLKLRRQLSFDKYDENPAMNLDFYGNQNNICWLRHSQTYKGVKAGEEFNLIIEGGLGSLNKNHSVAISRIILEGATEVDYEEDTFFDFSEGLIGWQSGSNAGGKWVSIPYVFVNPNIGMPMPSVGQVLMVERYDLQSGVITIESPPITISSMTAKQMQARFWIKGSATYPVSFRVGLKTVNGGYDNEPFLNLNNYGNSPSQTWTSLENYVNIPADPKEDYFQLVLEVDLGGSLDNYIAIDTIEVTTSDRSAETLTLDGNSDWKIVQ